MDHLVLTNVGLYKVIADENYAEMIETMKIGRRRKGEGHAGYVLSYDPKQTSFKKAMISIVFTGMWLEALTHLLIMARFGETKFKEYDRKPYEEKLTLLGITDKELLDSVSKFRVARKSLIHEKAHYDDRKIKSAQSEAENAHHVLHAIHTQMLGEIG